MKASRSLSFLLVVGIMQAACLPLQVTAIPWFTPTPIPPTEIPTPTIVWFPPTPTHPPPPAGSSRPTPTQESLPALGEIILQDSFQDEGTWQSGKYPKGSIFTGEHELTISLSKPRSYLYSLRQAPELADFYLQVNANPTLCRGDDEYGILLRVSPSLDFFRFGLLCNGGARLDRILNGVASSPIPPHPISAVPPGAPSHSTLAVWASGKELRFYVNNHFLFSIQDSSLLKGKIGLYARAGGDTPLTVNFNTLVIYAVTP